MVANQHSYKSSHGVLGGSCLLQWLLQPETWLRKSGKWAAQSLAKMHLSSEPQTHGCLNPVLGHRQDFILKQIRLLKNAIKPYKSVIIHVVVVVVVAALLFLGERREEESSWKDAWCDHAQTMARFLADYGFQFPQFWWASLETSPAKQKPFLSAWMSHYWFSWQGCPSQLHCGQQRSVPHWLSLVKWAPVWHLVPSPEEDLHHSGAWKGLFQKAVIADVEKSLLWTLSSHDIWPISAQRSAVNFYYSSDSAASLIYRNNAHSISFFWSGGQKYNSTHMFVFLGSGISQIQKLIHRFTEFKARRNHENIWYDFLYFKAIQLQPVSPVLSPVVLLHLPEKYPAPDIPR